MAAGVNDFGAHGFDANGEFPGGDVYHVGVGASLHLAALFTGAAADDVRLVHSRAAAKATAALDRPDPGGPVKSQAWVIALLPPLPPLAAPSP